MPIAVQRIFNRLASVGNAGGLSQDLFSAVEIKADPSQQIKIYGVTAGYQYNTAADANSFSAGLVVGYLDFSLDLNPATLVLFVDSINIRSQFGEVFDYLDIPKPGIAASFKMTAKFDYSNPIIINGDRKVTYIVMPPFDNAAPVGTIQSNIIVRGEITQLANQDQVKYGPYVTR